MQKKVIAIPYIRLNDSTAFFPLATFNLNRVELDAIRDSIIAISGIPNLIVDLRNNPGGYALQSGFALYGRDAWFGTAPRRSGQQTQREILTANRCRRCDDNVNGSSP